MKITVILGTLLALAGTPAVAASHGAGGVIDHAAHAQQADASDELVEGEVRMVDLANGKLTLRHAPIPRYDMAAMTMAFRVADPALLSGIAAGDKVRFSVDKVNGRLLVTRIVKAH